MPTYNITNLAGALVKEDVNNSVGAATPTSHTRAWNALQQAGLVVGDVIQVIVPVPAWARTIWANKATDTANADLFSVTYRDASGTLSTLAPLGIGNATVGPAYSTAASNSVHFTMPAVASHIAVNLTLVTSVPGSCRIWLAFRDS